MDVTRERISCILELREILLSFQTGCNLAIQVYTMNKATNLHIFTKQCRSRTNNKFWSRTNNNFCCHPSATVRLANGLQKFSLSLSLSLSLSHTHTHSLSLSLSLSLSGKLTYRYLQQFSPFTDEVDGDMKDWKRTSADLSAIYRQQKQQENFLSRFHHESADADCAI